MLLSETQGICIGRRPVSNRGLARREPGDGVAGSGFPTGPGTPPSEELLAFIANSLAAVCSSVTAEMKFKDPVQRCMMANERLGTCVCGCQFAHPPKAGVGAFRPRSEAPE